MTKQQQLVHSKIQKMGHITQNIRCKQKIIKANSIPQSQKYQIRGATAKMNEIIL